MCNFVEYYVQKLWKNSEKNWKNSVARKVKEAEAAVNREKAEQKSRSGSIIWVFNIFALLPVIIMQYLYDSI